MRIGALYQGQGTCLFRVYAPNAGRVALEFAARGGETRAMERRPQGYWEARVEGIRPGELYKFRLDDKASHPDPASHYQPDGVHGPSQVWDHAGFKWTDEAWQGIPLDECIMYEIHPGTFTPEGTLEAVASKIPHLKDLGINAVEIMPVNQFPGVHNWGYDGTYLFAVQSSYGGPDGFKRLVDAFHAEGIAVILDVVYNHLGPEGNYLSEFGPYFTSHYKTPWGSAINFDGAGSDQVRDFFIENALYWMREFHVDGLRLDATHQMYDMSARHFLSELEERITEFSGRHGRQRHLIAESDLNDPGILTGRDAGGYGMQAQWLDDFQHCVDSMLRGGKSGYRTDYGNSDQFVKVNREGFVYAGEYCPSRGRRFGASSALRPPGQFIVFIQNHDQVGNRPLGERFNEIVDFEAYKLAAGAMFVSPYIPLLFMGEEYAETNPFLFFADFSDPAIVKAVRDGRREEFAFLHVGDDVPDPASPETFQRSKLDWNRKESGRHRVMLDFYRELIALRKSLPSLKRLNREGMEMDGEGLAFKLVRRSQGTGDVETGEILCLMNFAPGAARMDSHVREGEWELVLDSSDKRWGGPGPGAPRLVRPGAVLEVPGRCFYLYKRSDVKPG
ncbi:MAG: malto-oligosyltrehalose trehalohydrolase [Fibrobacteres bacterium]|nr:malto-oligosyltrehalose trehalohydrolase [Fibrobacterota bacterium]